MRKQLDSHFKRFLEHQILRADRMFLPAHLQSQRVCNVMESFGRERRIRVYGVNAYRALLHASGQAVDDERYPAPDRAAGRFANLAFRSFFQTVQEYDEALIEAIEGVPAKPPKQFAPRKDPKTPKPDRTVHQADTPEDELDASEEEPIAEPSEPILLARKRRVLPRHKSSVKSKRDSLYPKDSVQERGRPRKYVQVVNEDGSHNRAIIGQIFAHPDVSPVLIWVSGSKKLVPAPKGYSGVGTPPKLSKMAIDKAHTPFFYRKYPRRGGDDDDSAQGEGMQKTSKRGRVKIERIIPEPEDRPEGTLEVAGDDRANDEAEDAFDVPDSIQPVPGDAEMINAHVTVPNVEQEAQVSQEGDQSNLLLVESDPAKKVQNRKRKSKNQPDLSTELTLDAGEKADNPSSTTAKKRRKIAGAGTPEAFRSQTPSVRLPSIDIKGHGSASMPTVAPTPVDVGPYAASRHTTQTNGPGSVRVTTPAPYTPPIFHDPQLSFPHQNTTVRPTSFATRPPPPQNSTHFWQSPPPTQAAGPTWATAARPHPVGPANQAIAPYIAPPPADPIRPHQQQSIPLTSGEPTRMNSFQDVTPANDISRSPSPMIGQSRESSAPLFVVSLSRNVEEKPFELPRMILQASENIRRDQVSPSRMYPMPPPHLDPSPRPEYDLPPELRQAIQRSRINAGLPAEAPPADPSAEFERLPKASGRPQNGVSDNSRETSILPPVSSASLGRLSADRSTANGIEATVSAANGSSANGIPADGNGANRAATRSTSVDEAAGGNTPSGGSALPDTGHQSSTVPADPPIVSTSTESPNHFTTPLPDIVETQPASLPAAALVVTPPSNAQHIPQPAAPSVQQTSRAHPAPRPRGPSVLETPHSKPRSNKPSSRAGSSAATPMREISPNQKPDTPQSAQHLYRKSTRHHEYLPLITQVVEWTWEQSDELTSFTRFWSKTVVCFMTLDYTASTSHGLNDGWALIILMRPQR